MSAFTDAATPEATSTDASIGGLLGQLADTAPDIFAQRDRKHHDAFCEFLCDCEIKELDKMQVAENILRQIDLLERLEIHLSPQRRQEREDARAVLENGQRQIDRILNALCLANEFMNV